MTIACHFSQLNIEFNQSALFPPITSTLLCQQNALVGHNGRGKSVLMRLLAGQLTPTSGNIHWVKPFLHIDQLSRLDGNTIADALGINKLVEAFTRVNIGEATIDDFEFLEDKWHLPSTWQRLLDSAKLSVTVESPICQLSGGEQTRLALCRAFLHPDHFLLLDEPDNHLDQEGQQWLINQLAQHHGGSLVITHNRSLLAHIQTIFELTENGLFEYGGNYTLYEQQKNAELLSIEAKSEQLNKQIHQEKRHQQATLQKTAQRRKQGEKVRRSGSQSLLLLDMKANKAEKRQANVTERHQRVMNNLQSQLQETQKQQTHIKPQKMILNYQPDGAKITLFASQLQLPYGDMKPLSFTAYTGEHWHIKGRNGSGKSTLLKILAGKMTAKSGEIRLDENFCYLDQHLNLLDKKLSVVEALHNYQPAFTVEQWRTQLGMLRIRGDKSLQLLGQLSGGEQLKVTLLALTHSPTPPAILLLDEPDNHLDLDSKILLENLIREYQGTLFLVSHDDEFVKHCSITHELILTS
ncbi:ATP-binding cassette domain-containing protein [Providencia sneebia]|uniref:ABC transporter ATP-binding protein n=1 Tax=Providencia sneebia DSM 19967 TaxID=1141660 RepID=K8WLV6_9GAMM|nr:ATP-binding cassette domain-containing protein [Providencia sneebia]EKT60931.1 ABC transporter ATP-binding protein [Providencia sneebia DSM 19967]